MMPLPRSAADPGSSSLPGGDRVVYVPVGPDPPRPQKTRPPMTHAMLFFPDYRAANPYQALLHVHAGRDLYPRPGTIGEAIALQGRCGVGGRVIFHLHWED